MLVVLPLSTLTLNNQYECSVSSCACCKFVKLHLNLCSVCRVKNVLIIQKPVELSLLHFLIWNIYFISGKNQHDVRGRAEGQIVGCIPEHSRSHGTCSFQPPHLGVSADIARCGRPREIFQWIDGVAMYYASHESLSSGTCVWGMMSLKWPTYWAGVLSPDFSACIFRNKLIEIWFYGSKAKWVLAVECQLPLVYCLL